MIALLNCILKLSIMTAVVFGIVYFFAVDAIARWIKR